jgi:hypothetical protein
MRDDGFDEREALLAYKAVLELVVWMVHRQEQQAADPERDQAHRSLFYEALTACDPDELSNLAFIAAGWNRRDPDELFEYSLDSLLSGIVQQRGWLASAKTRSLVAAAPDTAADDPQIVPDPTDRTA